MKRGRGIRVIGAVAALVVLVLAVRAFVAQAYTVFQLPMAPTLEPDQIVLVDELTPRWAPYSRGEIVVYEPPPEADAPSPFVARVLGLPGETVELRDGQVVVDGRVLSERYLPPRARTDPTRDGGRDSWVVPAESLFVLADNRETAIDSRTFGPVPLSSIFGRTSLRLLPLASAGPIPVPTYPAP